MLNRNLLLDTDSYKTSHWLQYPKGTKNLFNYLESRGGAYDRTVFFGLQYVLAEYLTRGVRIEDVLEAESFYKKHGVPFNKDGWYRIATELNGEIPLRIKAVPEGLVLPTKVPLLTAEATHPDFAWVVGWFETMIMRLWYPITVATLSYHVKQTIKTYMEVTCDNLDGLPFKLHDFGSRGVSSLESAAIGGAAHLVNFMGSDTVPGVILANEYYDAGMAGFSIPAAEHSTITSWGRDGEVDAYRNMIEQFAKPGSIVACVSDSYDIFHAASEIWGETLKTDVVNSGATVVIRPDSGEPVTVVNQLLHILDARFGSVKNSKGFRVLNNVRIIQGDGLNPNVIEAILKSAKLAGYSADNIAFGMGGGLLQQVNRDTLRFAFKCSEITIEHEDGTVEHRPVFKDPVTDKGKKSKSGRLGTRVRNGRYEAYDVRAEGEGENILQTVFEDGHFTSFTDFNRIRALAK